MAHFFNVYAEDGYESTHKTLAAAVRAAKRGARKRRMIYKVVRTDSYGMTGGGHGTVVWSSDGEF